MSMNPRQSLRARVALLMKEAAPEQRAVICDVGANPVHTPPYAVIKRHNACDVVGFEPQQDAYQALVDNAADNEIYINAALGKAGDATLHLYPSDGFSSLYRLKRAALRWLGQFEPELDGETTVPVTLRGLDEVAEVPAIDLLKIDVQGAELDIIGSGRKKLGGAVTMIPEIRYYQLYENEPSMADLDHEIRSQGFVLHKFLQAKSVPLPNSQAKRMARRANRNQVIDGDVVYIRDMEDPDSLSDDQLKKQALFAGCVYDSHDLAVRCLDLLVTRGAVDAGLPSAYVDLLTADFRRDLEAAQ